MVVLYFAGCPNWREAGQRIRLALDEVGHRDTAVTFRPVDAGAVTGFADSPTFTVDGLDLFPASATLDGLSCRVYLTVAGSGRRAHGRRVGRRAPGKDHP